MSLDNESYLGQKRLKEVGNVKLKDNDIIKINYTSNKTLEFYFNQKLLWKALKDSWEVGTTFTVYIRAYWMTNYGTILHTY